MQIVLPAALPPAPYAQELAKHLPERAPVLHAWLQAAPPARIEPFDPLAAGCTALQAWQLQQAGFQPEPGMAIGAGLGPWLARDQVRDDAPVWLAELVHLALGTDQAVLQTLTDSPLTHQEAKALFAAAQPLFDDTGFAAETLSPLRWRMHLPVSVVPRGASPDVVAGQALRQWWQLDEAFRPWRRLLNEIQMAWHDHPVNTARAERGLAPVNGLWLYGGARRFTPCAQDPSCTIADDLLDARRHGDWSAWLDALADLDRCVLAPLSRPPGAGGLPDRPLTLHLLGENRNATLTLAPRPSWLNWLPRRKTNWKTWWSPPV